MTVRGGGFPTGPLALMPIDVKSVSSSRPWLRSHHEEDYRYALKVAVIATSNVLKSNIRADFKVEGSHNARLILLTPLPFWEGAVQ
jgi:hypothetical protein